MTADKSTTVAAETKASGTSNTKKDSRSSPRPELVLSPQSVISSLLQTVDMERAEATYPQDVERILQLVRTTIPGGFKTVNAQVQQALMQNAVLNTLQEASVAISSGPKGKKGSGRDGKHSIADLYSGLE